MMVIPQERVQQRTEGRNIDVHMSQGTEEIAQIEQVVSNEQTGVKTLRLPRKSRNHETPDELVDVKTNRVPGKNDDPCHADRGRR